MTGKVLSSPPAGSDVSLIVDWLELTAFLSQFNQSSIDDVISCQDIQSDEVENDIAEKDRLEDETRTSIEAEVTFRQNSLAASYPFEFSGDGEQLMFTGNDKLDGPYTTYLMCLVLSHVTKSPILAVPPNADAVRLARKRLFQIIATLAAAGHAQGGAVSLGWPREKKESILEVVARAAQGASTGKARPVPHELEPKSAKDGGLDVLAWKAAPDGPPPEAFFFVQAASGLNWVGKSAKADYLKFLYCYFSAQPTCNMAFMTICPFRLSEDEKAYQQIEHGLISDRTRAPVMVMAALQAAADGNAFIDEIENFPVLAKWLGRYRRQNRGAL